MTIVTERVFQRLSLWQMPSSPIVHAAVFAIGAAIGVGTALTVTRRRQLAPPVSPTVSLSPSVELKKTGIPGLLEANNVAGGDVLQYGNPG